MTRVNKSLVAAALWLVCI